jgi:hypothetical protein
MGAFEGREEPQWQEACGKEASSLFGEAGRARWQRLAMANDAASSDDQSRLEVVLGGLEQRASVREAWLALARAKGSMVGRQ